MKYFVSLILITTAFGCQKIDSEQVEPVKSPETQAIGPYIVSFNPATNLYQHDININIQQNEGYFEYKIFSNQKEELQLVENNVSVAGCQGQDVQQKIFWLPDEKNKAVYQSLTLNSIFNTAKKMNGTLIYSFKNLNGCSQIQIHTKIKNNQKQTKVGKACNSNVDVDQCRILVACKEKTITNSFYEVEVQNQNGTLILSKFYTTIDGQRIHSDSSTVSSKENETHLIYNADLTNMSLDINTLNYESTLIEYKNGLRNTIRFNCDL